MLNHCMEGWAKEGEGGREGGGGRGGEEREGAPHNRFHISVYL